MSESYMPIDPDLRIRPVLNAGKYGEDGSAVLDRYDLIDARSEEQKAQGIKCDQFQVVVRTPEHGVIRIFADPPRQPGTVAVKWFNQLGLSDDELRQNFGSQEEATAFLKSRLDGTKVVVTLRVDTYNDRTTGERKQVNRVSDIVKLG